MNYQYSYDTLTALNMADKKIPSRKPMKMATKAIQRQFTMLPSEADLIEELRRRYQMRALAKKPDPVDIAKSEVVRAGLHSLSRMSDAQLYAAIEGVEELKEGRRKAVKM